MLPDDRGAPASESIAICVEPVPPQNEPVPRQNEPVPRQNEPVSPHKRASPTPKSCRMTTTTKPATLAELRASGWISKTVKQEIYDNFIRMLSQGDELFPGIVGYDDTVIPEINLALIAQHDMLFLGEKGQAKSRLMRLAGAVPRRRDSLHRPGRSAAARRSVPPDHPACARISSPARRRRKCPSPGGRAASGTPSGSPRAPSLPTSSARSIRPSWPAAPACRPKRRCTSGSSRGCTAASSPSTNCPSWTSWCRSGCSTSWKSATCRFAAIRSTSTSTC